MAFDFDLRYFNWGRLGVERYASTKHIGHHGSWKLDSDTAHCVNHKATHRILETPQYEDKCLIAFMDYNTRGKSHAAIRIHDTNTLEAAAVDAKRATTYSKTCPFESSTVRSNSGWNCI